MSVVTIQALPGRKSTYQLSNVAIQLYDILQGLSKDEYISPLSYVVYLGCNIFPYSFNNQQFVLTFWKVNFIQFKWKWCFTSTIDQENPNGKVCTNLWLASSNRTLKDMVRNMISHSSFSKSLWGESLNTTVYILNRVPGIVVAETPYELYTCKNPSVRHFHI